MRVTKDVLKWDDWTSMLFEVRKQELKFKSMEVQWRDMKYDEECRLLKARHEDRMEGLSLIQDEILRVEQAITVAQKSDERLKLLEWLSSVDPSINYHAARKMHAQSTGDWLVKGSKDFQRWKKDPGSQLWLCGKGISATI